MKIELNSFLIGVSLTMFIVGAWYREPVFILGIVPIIIAGINYLVERS